MDTKISRAKEILKDEILALKSIPLNDNLLQAVELITKCEGKLILSGMGKAGIIAQKIAATFSSTGTPAVFLHPGEAQHGDLGVIGSGDLLVALSNSGKTRELIDTVFLSKNIGNHKIIVITSNLDSELAKLADLAIDIGSPKEACYLGLAPTSSTTAMLAIGDVLALLVMEEKGFSARDYHLRHHGGYLGQISQELAKDE